MVVVSTAYDEDGPVQGGKQKEERWKYNPGYSVYFFPHNF